MQCPKCGEGNMVQRSERNRPAQFAVVAAVFLSIGAGLQVSAVQMWPWLFYGIGVFVLVQLGVKLSDAAAAYCPRCHHTMSIWPWTKT